VGPYDIPLPKDSPYYEYRGVKHLFLTDLYTGRYSIARDGGWPKIVKKLPRQIHAIHVENPWLWQLAKKIQSLPQYSNSLLIYASENIEYPLKKDILDNAEIEYPDAIISDIKQLETKAAREADLVAAVTEADARQLRSFGAQCVVLAPNGIRPWTAQPALVDKWKQQLPSEPWLLYVASAHLPMSLDL